VGGMKSGEWAALDQRIEYQLSMLLPNGTSASGLAYKQKENILNIFFN